MGTVPHRHHKMKSALLLSLLVVYVNAIDFEEDLRKIANVRTGSGYNSKKPRLFLVTTASTTSTFRTTTLCYSTSGTSSISGNCRRKKSMIDFDGSDLLDIPAPSRSHPIIDSGFENEDEFLEGDLNHRAARQNFFNFLLYWATTTSTSTFTSFTRTGALVLAGTVCAPSGVVQCPTTG